MSELESRKLLSDLKFCVLDLETTGGNHETDRIIEIGMVKIDSLQISDNYSTLINPQMHIPDFIQKLTSIKQKNVEEAPLIKDCIDKIIDFIGDRILVAHNTSFDIPFINSVLRRLGRDELKNKVICTNVMTKHMIPSITNSNLTYMSSLFGLSHGQAHRALDDAIASGELLIKYCEIFIQKGIRKVNQLYYPKNKFELDRIHLDMQTELKDLFNLLEVNQIPKVIVFKGDQGTILSILPTESLHTDRETIEKLYHDLDWKVITVRLATPFLDALLLYASHYQKFSEDQKELTLNYLAQRFNGDELNIESVDFVLSHHLVREQIIVHSFLNTNTKGVSIFKLSSQKKKLFQYLLSATRRFEGNQKGVRKIFIPKEVFPIIQSYLAQTQKTQKLFISRKDVHQGREHVISLIEKFERETINNSPFPTEHL